MIQSRYRVWQTEIGNHESVFVLYPPPPKNPKNQNFEKMKKIAGDIIILHNCTSRGTVPEIWSETEFFAILSHFLPLYPPKHRENQNFKTMKKASWDVIALHMFIKNHNHMTYASWDMEYHYWPLLIPKIKIWSKLKNLEILSYYTCVPYMKIIWRMVSEIKGTTIFLSFWVIFCPLTFLTAWKLKILKE